MINSNIKKEIKNYNLSELNEVYYYLNNKINHLIDSSNLYQTPITYDIDSVKKEAINFYSGYFTLNNIYYYDNLHSSKYLRFLDKKIVNTLYESNNKISPFDLPIIQSEDLDGYYIISHKRKTSNNTNITIFKEISLPKLDNSNSIISGYIHEISHTQILPKGFGINCDVNDELIAIFLELLYSADCNNNKVLLLRLKELLKNLKYLDYYYSKNLYPNIKNYMLYIESTLKAIKLLYIYDTSKINDKSRIIDDIQKLFNQVISIEELLDKYELNKSNYKNKDYIKHFIK